MVEFRQMLSHQSLFAMLLEPNTDSGIIFQKARRLYFMNELILSVKTETLLDQTWQLLTHDGDNVEEVMQIYNRLGKCWNSIKDCSSDTEYMRIWTDVVECEKSILKFA